MNAARKILLPAIASALLAAAVSCGGGVGGDFDITLYTGQLELGGDEVSLDELRDMGKPVVLHFWGGFCTICQAGMPVLEAEYEAYRTSVTFIGVDVGPHLRLGTRDQARRLLNDMEIDFPNGTAMDPDVVETWDLRKSMPMTYFLDVDGDVHDVWVGEVRRATLQAKIQALLADHRAREDD